MGLFQKNIKLINLLAFYFFMLEATGSIPIKQLAGLKSVTFYEVTGNLFTHTFNPDSYELNHRFSNHMNSSERDFEGWLGVEFFDVFFSNSNGDFNTEGEFITVEATFDVPFGGGGLNIAEVELNFTDGHSQFGSFISSFQALGSTYMQGSEKKGADCDLTTLTTMGFTTSSNPKKLRITVGFTNKERYINYKGCQNDGYSITVNGNIYNVDNPTGLEVIKNNTGCDSIIYINLDFGLVKSDTFKYIGCKGDNYFFIVNGNIYNEHNPVGVEKFTTKTGCDSILYIDMLFHDTSFHKIELTYCKGSGFSIEINGTIYNEQNPYGLEILQSKLGCDSTIFIKLNFLNTYNKSINYQGCENDGYFVEVNGHIYNQSKPIGVENLRTKGGCDSIININLTYHDTSFQIIQTYKCKGDNFSIIINGHSYNEQNPFGIEVLQTKKGCDSIIQINMIFLDAYRKEFVYEGCKNDGYSILINNVEYNEFHSQGTEIVHNNIGCDTIYKIDLIYHAIDSVFINYEGCLGDGYFLKIGNSIYNEKNKIGTEILKNKYQCDSTIMVRLEFEDCEKIYEEKCKIEIPNIFSPNNDGKNDNFFIRINEGCEFKDFYIYIYDRWGNLVYFSDKLDFKWNGKKGENPVVSGVYTYFVIYETKYSQIKKFSGDVTLLK